MPTSVQLDFINLTAYVGIPFTLRYSGIWRHDPLIPEAPQWQLASDSDPAEMQDLGLGLVRIMPQQVGGIKVLAVAADGMNGEYFVKVEPATTIAGFGINQKIGAKIECVQFGDKPELPPLPPMSPEE